MYTCTSKTSLPVLILAIVSAGCGSVYDEPTIDDFNGRLTHKGQAVSFPADEKVVLRLTFHKKAERFGIPISPDGTFDITWMPIGKYSATLERSGTSGPGDAGRGASKQIYNVPDGLTIEEGQTEYVVELGEGFRL